MSTQPKNSRIHQLETDLAQQTANLAQQVTINANLTQQIVFLTQQLANLTQQLNTLQLTRQQDLERIQELEAHERMYSCLLNKPLHESDTGGGGGGTSR